MTAKFNPRKNECGMCSKEYVSINWDSELLGDFLSIKDIDNELVRPVYNTRYKQDYDDIINHIDKNLGVWVGDKGQHLFVAEERMPDGLVLDVRKEWVGNNNRNDYLINGINNLQDLSEDIILESGSDYCMYRGLHGEVARYIKTQMGENIIKYFPRGVEFWTTDFNEAETFSIEGIGSDRREEGVDDAIIIATKVRPQDVLQIYGSELRLLPTTSTYEIRCGDVWVIR